MGNLVGLPVSFPGGTSEVYTTPFPIAPGTIAYDGLGGEYIFLDATGDIGNGCVCMISRDANFNAVPFAVNLYGRVGVAMAQATSNHGVWVQVAGYTAGYVQCAGGSSLGTSSGRALQATSLSSPATGLLTVSTATSDESGYIFGMWVTQLTSTGTTSVDTTDAGSSTSAYTGLRTRVFMDHPYILQPNHTSV